MTLCQTFAATSIVAVLAIACSSDSPAIAPGLPAPTGIPVNASGHALIEELIACDGPGYWDREVLRNNLERDGQEQVEFLQTMLEGCYLAKTATPQPTLIPEPLSVESLQLLAYYHALLGFKDDPAFHRFCYGRVNSEYTLWAEDIKAMHATLSEGGTQYLQQTGIAPFHLWQIGWGYCRNQGQETEQISEIKSLMKPAWLAATPSRLVLPSPIESDRMRKLRALDDVTFKAEVCPDLIDAYGLWLGDGRTVAELDLYLVDKGIIPEELALSKERCNIP